MTRHGKTNKKSQTSKECVYYNKTYNFWCKVTPHKSPTLYFVLRGIAITLRLLCVNMTWIYINKSVPYTLPFSLNNHSHGAWHRSSGFVDCFKWY